MECFLQHLECGRKFRNVQFFLHVRLLHVRLLQEGPYLYAVVTSTCAKITVCYVIRDISGLWIFLDAF